MKNSPHRRKHEQKKAIRKSQKEETYQTEKKEIKEKAKKTYLSSPRKVKISEAKASSKHQHHMTSPDNVDWETEPKHIHQKGAHWIKAIQKKTLNATNHLQKKFQKLNFLKRKK